MDYKGSPFSIDGLRPDLSGSEEACSRASKGPLGQPLQIEPTLRDLGQRVVHPLQGAIVAGIPRSISNVFQHELGGHRLGNQIRRWPGCISNVQAEAMLSPVLSSDQCGERTRRLRKSDVAATAAQ